MKRKWFLRALGLFLVAGICWLLVGVTINFSPKSPRQKLDKSRALWQAKGIKDYQMTISFGSFSYLGGFNVVVRDNKVSHLDNTLLGSSEPNPRTPLDAELRIYRSTIGKSLLSEVSDYSMDNLFDFVSSKVKDYPVPPSVAWCNVPGITLRYEAEYNLEDGHITRLSYTNCNIWDFGGGLVCPVATDCSVNAIFRNFEILPPS